MASWRSLYVGGSYGRVQAVVTWALENWQDFDTWCCLKNIDPLDLPAYRFYYLIVAFVKEVNNYEDASFEENMAKFDAYGLPWENGALSTATNSANTTKEKTSTDDKAYTPSWWRGDDANAKIAQTMMVSLPKQIGK